MWNFLTAEVEPHIEPYLEDMRESYRGIIDRFIPDGGGVQDGGGGEGKQPVDECDRLIEDEQQCEKLGGTPYIDYVKNHCICNKDDETWQDWCVREGGTWIKFRDIVDNDGFDWDGIVECTFYPQEAKRYCEEELGGVFTDVDPRDDFEQFTECREKDKAFFGLAPQSSDTCPAPSDITFKNFNVEDGGWYSFDLINKSPWEQDIFYGDLYKGNGEYWHEYECTIDPKDDKRMDCGSAPGETELGTAVGTGYITFDSNVFGSSCSKELEVPADYGTVAAPVTPSSDCPAGESMCAGSCCSIGHCCDTGSGLGCYSDCAGYD